MLVGFGLMAADGLAKLITLVGLAQLGALHDSLQSWLVVSGKSQYLVSNPTLLAITSALVMGVGLLALAAVVLLLAGRDKLGVRNGTLALPRCGRARRRRPTSNAARCRRRRSAPKKHALRLNRSDSSPRSGLPLHQASASADAGAQPS